MAAELFLQLYLLRNRAAHKGQIAQRLNAVRGVNV